MFWQQLVNGLTLGSTYSLVALGYTLIMGVLNIINMAHGEIFMFGAFVGLFLMTYLKVNIFVAMAGAMVAGALLGTLMEMLALRPLRRRAVSHLAPLISTIGVSIFLENLALKIFGPQSQAFPSGALSGVAMQLGPVRITLVQIVILGISFGLMFVLRFWLAKTRVGKAIRTTAESIETANLLGINTNKIINGNKYTTAIFRTIKYSFWLIVSAKHHSTENQYQRQKDPRCTLGKTGFESEYTA